MTWRINKSIKHDSDWKLTSKSSIKSLVWMQWMFSTYFANPFRHQKAHRWSWEDFNQDKLVECLCAPLLISILSCDMNASKSCLFKFWENWNTKAICGCIRGRQGLLWRHYMQVTFKTSQHHGNQLFEEFPTRFSTTLRAIDTHRNRCAIAPKSFPLLNRFLKNENMFRRSAATQIFI